MATRTRTRPTQAQRRAVTRAKITGAGLEALAENGYAAMTFADVAARAGVSRGALLHYFPAKPDLALATIEEGAVDLVDDLRRRVGAAETDEGVLDAIRAVFTGPLFQAFLALQVHARTDDELNARLERIAGDAVTAIGEVALSSWGSELARHERWPAFLWLVNDTVRGIALSSAADRADAGDAVWVMARRMLAAELVDLRSTLP